MLKKIISGGQTGADLAALDFAIKYHIPHGGWISKGRRTEAGILPPQYNLQETETSSYRARTKLNVINSDGTLIINVGDISGGTFLTRSLAMGLNKPCFSFQCDKDHHYQLEGLLAWMRKNDIEVLNVAGPRESKSPGIYCIALSVLERCKELSFK